MIFLFLGKTDVVKRDFFSHEIQKHIFAGKAAAGLIFSSDVVYSLPVPENHLIIMEKKR